MGVSSRKNKAAKEEVDNFRSTLVKGTEIMTGSGLLGTIVEIDKDTNSAIIDSEGAKSRWVLDALVKPRVATTPNVADIENEDIEEPAQIGDVEQEKFKEVEEK
jgi:preprotein translocase subunit YajC